MIIKFDKLNDDFLLIRGKRYLLNGSLKGVIIEGETFNFEDLEGLSVTSDKGTVGNIGTKHASGENYIKETMFDLWK